MFKFAHSKISWVQLISTLVVGLIIIALGISAFFSSKRSLELAKQVNVATSQTSGIIIAQQDLSLYEIRFYQWTHGDIPRQNVQAARDLLIHLLDAKDPTGISLGQRSVPGFLTGLRNADAMMAQAPEGYLPELLQKKYGPQLDQILNSTESEGSKLITDYQNTISKQIKSYTDAQHNAALMNLYLVLASRILGIVFIVWLVASYRRRSALRRLEVDTTQQKLQEVRTSLKTAHEAVESLREENKEKSETVSTVNHELRTPLTSIIGYIDILKDFSVTKEDKEFHQYLAVMDRNASILLELIEDILSLSALNSPTSLTDTVNIDLVSVCELSVSDLRLPIEVANITLSANYDLEESYTVRGNGPLLSRVFTNLISNAIKFSPLNSRIDITFSRTKTENMGDTVHVEVKDRGIGIPETEIDKLFSNFFRASNASQMNIPGSGLGLAIVKRIIGLHGGDISVISARDKGTTVIMELPLEVAPVEAMVIAQRESVLERAIEKLAKCPMDKLAETAHDLGGAIGFYTFSIESLQVLDFSRWLGENPSADEDRVLSKKRAVLDSLNTALARIKGEVIS